MDLLHYTLLFLLIVTFIVAISFYKYFSKASKSLNAKLDVYKAHTDTQIPIREDFQITDILAEFCFEKTPWEKYNVLRSQMDSIKRSLVHDMAEQMYRDGFIEFSERDDFWDSECEVLTAKLKVMIPK